MGVNYILKYGFSLQVLKYGGVYAAELRAGNRSQDPYTLYTDCQKRVLRRDQASPFSLVPSQFHFLLSTPSIQLQVKSIISHLYWPRSCISQCTYGVSLNLFRQFPQHVNLLWLCISTRKSRHRLIQPSCS